MTGGPASVVVDGVRLAYLEYGPADGPPVLCLHGFPDSAVTFRQLAGRLAASGYRVITPWLRGYPPSEVVDASYQPAALARDAIGLADALAPGRPAWLIGHDWGGLATYGAAVLAPDRWRSIVVLSVPPTRWFRRFVGGDWDQQQASWYQFFFQIEPLADAAVAASDFAFLDRLWTAWSPGWTADPAVFAAAKASIAEGFPAALRHYRDTWQVQRQDPELAGDQAAIIAGPLELPALVLHGERDGCIKPGAFVDTGDYFTGPVRIEALPGVGHFLHLEAPDLVAGKIVDFLARTEEAAVRDACGANRGMASPQARTE